MLSLIALIARVLHAYCVSLHTVLTLSQNLYVYSTHHHVLV
jgi:hypothetical protein